MPSVGFAGTSSRYNRIEGLSLAAVAGRELGNDHTIAALIRLGIADVVPNAEIEFSRERGFRARSVSVYHRLAASNEWGNPLALGASLGALIIGRDEGFYYRVGGAEVRVVDSTRHLLEARIFVERHRTARVKNDFSFADAFGDHKFPPNIQALEGDMAGFAVVANRRVGEVATEFRLFAEAKLEGGVGDFDYTRGMVEVIASHPFVGFLLPSLSLSAGTSGGTLPLQRNWFVGGSRSVRGQRSGVMVGDSFWMTQTELGVINVFSRPVLFFDAAWAGDRDRIGEPGRVATGAGIGGSFFDGTLRLDVARGIYPGRSWRGALYLDARL